MIRHSLAMLTLLALPASLGAAQESLPVIVTSGEGIVRIAPDRAWLTVAAEARAREAGDAQAQAARMMTTVQEKLGAAGIAREAIRTIAYHVQPEFDWINGRQVSRGFVARNTIEVRIDEIARTGEILDLVVGAGATSVQNLRFDVTTRETHEHEALRRAVSDARGRAEAVAAGAGETIDRTLRIEQVGARIQPPMMEALRTAQVDMAMPTPIEPGEIEIRAQVSLTVLIK